MVKIINELGAGGRIGAALGGGFSDALGQLAQHKLDTMKQEKEYQSVAKTIKQFNPYISETEAYNIARVPEARKAFFERGVTISGGENQQGIEGQQAEPRKIDFGITPAEKKEKQKQVYEFKQLNEAEGKIAQKELGSIDTALKLIDKLEKEKVSVPSFWKRKLYGEKPYDVTSNKDQQRLAQLYENIATDETIKTLEQSGSKAGASFLNAIRQGKASIFQDYEVQKEILKSLKGNLVPLVENNQKMKAIIQKNKGITPLDLIEQFERLNQPEVQQEQKQTASEQLVENKTDAQLDALPDGSQIERNGKVEEKRNGKWVIIG